jgi:hypothetical protein
MIDIPHNHFPFMSLLGGYLKSIEFDKVFNKKHMGHGNVLGIAGRSFTIDT